MNRSNLNMIFRVNVKINKHFDFEEISMWHYELESKKPIKSTNTTLHALNLMFALYYISYLLSVQQPNRNSVELDDNLK